MNTNNCVVISDNLATFQMVTKAIQGLPSFALVGNASTPDDALALLFEVQPQLVFIDINNQIDWHFVAEIHRYIKDLPAFVVIASQDELNNAMEYGAIGFVSNLMDTFHIKKILMKWLRQQTLHPTTITLANQHHQLSANPNTAGNQVDYTRFFEEINQEFKSIKNRISKLTETVEQKEQSNNQMPQLLINIEKLLKQWQPKFDVSQMTLPSFEGNNSQSNQQKPIICIKSYGDYKFVEIENILFLKADNNSTDITLSNGEVITAFKTLKHFVNLLPEGFERIHNSYIVNITQISRVHLGNAAVYLKNSKLQIPFSKSYKEKVEDIIKIIIGNGAHDDDDDNGNEEE